MGGPSIKGSSRMWSVAKAQTWNTLTVCLFVFLFVWPVKYQWVKRHLPRSWTWFTGHHRTNCLFQAVSTQLGFPVIPAGFPNFWLSIQTFCWWDSRRCWRHLVPASCPTYAAQIWRWKTSSLASGRNFWRNMWIWLEMLWIMDWLCGDFNIQVLNIIYIYIYPRKNRILVQTLPTPFDLNFSKGPRSIAQIPYNWSIWVWLIGYDQVHIPPRISESRLWKFVKCLTVAMPTLPW